MALKFDPTPHKPDPMVPLNLQVKESTQAKLRDWGKEIEKDPSILASEMLDWMVEHREELKGRSKRGGARPGAGKKPPKVGAPAARP